MQGQIVVSAGWGQGSVSDIKQCEGGCRLAWKGLLMGWSYKRNVGGPEKSWFRMVEIKCKSLLLTERGPLSLLQGLQ